MIARRESLPPRRVTRPGGWVELVEADPVGVYFGTYIQESLRQCAVALVIIGPRWLDAQGGSGRRLDDPEDWVRHEIESVLALGLRVIPLLVDGAHVPHAADLPDSLPAHHSLPVLEPR